MYDKNFVHLLNTILQSPTSVLSDNRNTLFKTQRRLHMLCWSPGLASLEIIETFSHWLNYWDKYRFLFNRPFPFRPWPNCLSYLVLSRRWYISVPKTQKRDQILFHLGAIFNLSESLLVQLEIMKMPLMGSPYHGWSNRVLSVHMTSHSNWIVDAKVIYMWSIWMLFI